MILQRILNFIFWWRRPSFKEALDKATRSSKNYIKKIEKTETQEHRAKANAVSAILENKEKNRH